MSEGETKKRQRRREQKKKKSGQLTPAEAAVSVLASGQGTGGSVLQLRGSYLSQGGSEQIGANGTARVCFMSQHTAEAWAPHHRLFLGLHSNLFYV